MNQKQTLSLVIPAKDEQDNIANLLTEASGSCGITMASRLSWWMMAVGILTSNDHPKLVEKVADYSNVLAAAVCRRTR